MKTFPELAFFSFSLKMQFKTTDMAPWAQHEVGNETDHCIFEANILRCTRWKFVFAPVLFSYSKNELFS